MGRKGIWVGSLTGKARATLSPGPPTPVLTVLSELSLRGLPAGSEGQRPTTASSSWGPRSHLGPWGATSQDLPHPYPLTSH